METSLGVLENFELLGRLLRVLLCRVKGVVETPERVETLGIFIARNENDIPLPMPVFVFPICLPVGPSEVVLTTFVIVIARDEQRLEWSHTEAFCKLLQELARCVESSAVALICEISRHHDVVESLDFQVFA